MSELKVIRHEETNDGRFESNEVSANWMMVEDSKLWLMGTTSMTTNIVKVCLLNMDANRCTINGGTMGCYYSFELV